jgi:hypothetical protein
MPLSLANQTIQDLDIAAFQAALLESLWHHDEAPAILEALTPRPELAALPDDLQAYLHQADPTMLELAAHLVKKWGTRNDHAKTADN